MALRYNVGGRDRTFRIVFGIILAGFALLADVDPVWRIVAAVVAVIALGTAFVRYCPANAALRINTYKSD
jgi:Protein of unknown function (DUF2892)